MMKNVVKMVVICSVGILLTQISFGASSASLPFGDGFERTVGDSLAGEWEINSGVAIITNSPLLSGAGTNLAYSSVDLTLNVADGTPDYTNVWWTGYAKVTAQDDSESSPSVGTNVAAFYVNTSGALKAYSTNDWVTVATGLSVSSWHGFSVHLDYLNDTWDIYKSAASFSFGDSFSKQNSYPLGFNTSASQTKFQEFNVTGETYMDEVAVNIDSLATPVDDSTASTSVNASVELYLNGNLTGLLSQYFSEADSTMDGPLGDALKGALVVGDKVHVYTPSHASDWYVFERQADGAAWDKTPADVNPTIYLTTGIWLELVDGTNRQPAMTVSYDTLTTPADVTVNGTTGDGNGWTSLAWPETFSKGFGTPADLQFPAAQNGDIIWLFEQLQSGRMGYRRIKWDATRWEDNNGNATTALLTQGKAFWYFRNTSADGTWNADSIVE